MKVTHVALAPTRAAREAGRPALTPELLAATGARYSRSADGLEAILAKINPDDPEASVDSIFRMVDYGHQSVADMATVALFMDGVSILLAALVWNGCPTAGGQESSTRYINYSQARAVDPNALGIAPPLADEWRGSIESSFAAYERALESWSSVGEQFPDLTRIPRALLEDPSKEKAVARMRRNFAFDRARVFLPASAPTNMMLVMSARAWANLCANLSSMPLPEAHALAEMIRAELTLAAPRLVKHAHAKPGLQSGWKDEFARWQVLAQSSCKYLQADASEWCAPPNAALEVLAPDEMEAARDLTFHDNRYGWVGGGLRRTLVRFSWQAVAFAEVRDLNRHRTGTKWWPPVPVGFYDARDQWPAETPDAIHADARNIGAAAARRARQLLAQGDWSGLYFLPLGAQFGFEHGTTADKFIYEAELRTGVGAHYRYAAHLHDALALWFEQFPETRGLVLEGSAEPE
jgi:thymidylate synthase ThyX